MTRFVAGWNQPGYMPNPDDMWVQDDFQEAVTYLRQQIDHWWDGDYMAHSEMGGTSVIDARYQRAEAALVSATQAPVSALVYNDRGEVDYVLWIDKAEEGDK